MIIKNARVFTVEKKFVKADVRFQDTVQEIRPCLEGQTGIEEETRAGCGETVIDGDGKYLFPGLLDIHTHGAMNCDHSDGDPEGLLTMSRFYASRGVTSVCPTTMTLGEETLKTAAKAVRDFKAPADGARYVGVNLEGPFLCYAKKGAQNEEFLHKPDAALFHRLNEAAGGLVKIVTVAPEEEGSMEFIREVSKETTVSIGHTDADYETAMRAYAAGASHVTHLFNAMPPLHHRLPGVVGAAFDAGATAELICDGLHIHPSIVRMVHALFGNRLTLMSDSLRCTGMPDGTYLFGGQDIILKDGKACMAFDGVTLAGSTADVFQMIRNAVRFGIPLEDALWSASAGPADVIGESRIGRIKEGCRADLLLVSSDLELETVIIGGKPRR